MFNPYEVLGLSSKASQNEAKKAYRVLCRKHHPDNGGDAELFAQINKAWAMIQNGTVYSSSATFGRKRGVLTHVSLFTFQLS